ncbi:MAG: DUF6868 family protein [Cognaticolwellia sp.]
MDINEIITFLGWCTAINMAILVVVGICLFLLKGLVINVHKQIDWCRC